MRQRKLVYNFRKYEPSHADSGDTKIRHYVGCDAWDFKQVYWAFKDCYSKRAEQEERSPCRPCERAKGAEHEASNRQYAPYLCCKPAKLCICVLFVVPQF